jgi:hypothetical protein
MAVGRSDYEERKENRINRYENHAKKASGEAEVLFDKAHNMASVIPFGQPILVGHHSEGADRSYRKRIDNTHRKSFEAAEKAAYYQDKAETAANSKTISGDNPDAINLYREKMVKLETVQEEMKTVNKAFAKGAGAYR